MALLLFRLAQKVLTSLPTAFIMVLVCFSLLLLYYQTAMGTVTNFFRVMTRPMSWLGGLRCSSHPPSHVISHLSHPLSSWTEDVLSQQNSSTRRISQYPPKTWRFLVMLIVSSLVFTAMGSAFCYSSIAIELANQSPSCTSHLILRCPATGSLRRSLFGD